MISRAALLHLFTRFRVALLLISGILGFLFTVTDILIITAGGLTVESVYWTIGSVLFTAYTLSSAWTYRSRKENDNASTTGDNFS